MVKDKTDSRATQHGRAPRFLLAMPNDLRHALEKAAIEGGRPLTSEINRRLANSLLDEGMRPPRHGAIYAMADPAHRATGEPTVAVYLPETFVPAGSRGEGSEASESDLLECFRRLSPEKQQALLALLK